MSGPSEAEWRVINARNSLCDTASDICQFSAKLSPDRIAMFGVAPTQTPGSGVAPRTASTPPAAHGASTPRTDHQKGPAMTDIDRGLRAVNEKIDQMTAELAEIRALAGVQEIVPDTP